MNPAAELLSELTARGVAVAPAGACLQLYPRSALSPRTSLGPPNLTCRRLPMPSTPWSAEPRSPPGQPSSTSSPITANKVAWLESEIDAWIASRPTARESREKRS